MVLVLVGHRASEAVGQILARDLLLARGRPVDGQCFGPHWTTVDHQGIIGQYGDGPDPAHFDPPGEGVGTTDRPQASREH